MRHQNHGLSTMVKSIFDCGQSTDDTLVVGDVFVGVERDVKVDLIIVNKRYQYLGGDYDYDWWVIWW